VTVKPVLLAADERVVARSSDIVSAVGIDVCSVAPTNTCRSTTAAYSTATVHRGHGQSRHFDFLNLLTASVANKK